MDYAEKLLEEVEKDLKKQKEEAEKILKDLKKLKDIESEIKSGKFLK